jgi:hypothetical protein
MKEELKFTQEEKHLQAQLNERENQEEILWKQKSRIRWLKMGGGGKKHKFLPSVNDSTQASQSHYIPQE